MKSEILRIKEFKLSKEFTVEDILIVIFHYADRLVVEEKDEHLKAHIVDEWMYIKRISKNNIRIFTSKEDKDMKLSAKNHLNPIIWDNQKNLDEFIDSFKGYIDSSERKYEQKAGQL